MGAARLIDGHPMGPVPAHLRDLKVATGSMTNDQWNACTTFFNDRAAFRYGRNMAPGTDGVATWKDPFSNRTLRSHSVPSSMRNPVRAPLVEPADGETFHIGIVSVGADALPNWQPTLYGTTAWHAAYGRREIVEMVNSQIHGATAALSEVSRGYTKLIDTGRITLFLAHTIAGYNHRVMQNWFSDQRPEVLAFIENRKKAAPGLRANIASTATTTFRPSTQRTHRAARTLLK